MPYGNANNVVVFVTRDRRYIVLLYEYHFNGFIRALSIHQESFEFNLEALVTQKKGSRNFRLRIIGLRPLSIFFV